MLESQPSVPVPPTLSIGELAGHISVALTPLEGYVIPVETGLGGLAGLVLSGQSGPAFTVEIGNGMQWSPATYPTTLQQGQYLRLTKLENGVELGVLHIGTPKVLTPVNGKDGVSITSVKIVDGRLLVTLSNGTVQDAGAVSSSTAGTGDDGSLVRLLNEYELVAEPMNVAHYSRELPSLEVQMEGVANYQYEFEVISPATLSFFDLSMEMPLGTPFPTLTYTDSKGREYQVTGEAYGRVWTRWRLPETLTLLSGDTFKLTFDADSPRFNAQSPSSLVAGAELGQVRFIGASSTADSVELDLLAVAFIMAGIQPGFVGVNPKETVGPLDPVDFPVCQTPGQIPAGGVARVEQKILWRAEDGVLRELGGSLTVYPSYDMALSSLPSTFSGIVDHDDGTPPTLMYRRADGSFWHMPLMEFFVGGGS